MGRNRFSSPNMRCCMLLYCFRFLNVSGTQIHGAYAEDIQTVNFIGGIVYENVIDGASPF